MVIVEVAAVEVVVSADIHKCGHSDNDTGDDCGRSGDCSDDMSC